MLLLPDHLRLDGRRILVARALRTEDYCPAPGVPMLPGTARASDVHAACQDPACYTLILLAVSQLPYVIRMSGPLYLCAALVLGGVFYRLRVAHLSSATAMQ
jgi:protoheme IX farnesyltransferase